MNFHTERVARYLREGRTVSGGCGASSGQKETAAEQKSNFDQMSAQAATVFGNSSQIFQDLTSAFQPILSAGPGQSGYSPAELQTLKSQAVTQTGQQYRNASAAAGERAAAAGGGNALLPSGTQAAIQGGIAAAGAQNTANTLTGIDIQNQELGRQNWMQAAGVLSGAPGVFNASTGAGSAATGSGSAAMEGATEVQKANDQWATDLTSIASSAAGAAGSIMCPAEGSPYLMADGSEQAVEMLAVGDKIAGIDSDPQTIEEIQSNFTNIVEVCTENGFIARNSPVHAFVLPRGGFVVAARALGKTISTANGPSIVTSVEPAGKAWVFNVITDGSHSYRASGVWALGVGEAERHVGMNEWAAIGDRMFKDRTKWATAGSK